MPMPMGRWGRTAEFFAVASLELEVAWDILDPEFVLVSVTTTTNAFDLTERLGKK
jgi:hypothetical protein